MKNQNLVVINGQIYDARSGMKMKNQAAAPGFRKMVSDISPSGNGPQKQLPNPKLVAPPHTPNVAAPQATPLHTPAKHLQTRTHNQITSESIHRRPDRTKTLLRAATKRPAHLDTARQQQAQAAHDPALKRAHREARAKSVSRPANVTHFSPTAVPAPTPQVVRPQEQPKATVALAQLQSQRLPKAPESPAKPQKLLAATEEDMSKNKKELFEERQHQVNRFFSKQPKLLTAAIGTLSVLLLIGYVTYLNLPGLSMRIAASRAGFSATMPNSAPSGYSLHGPVAYQPGEVNLSYASNTNDQTFTLTQKQSHWDSRALLENYVTKQTDNYLTYQEKGLTVYMYDGQASWVNGGIWYNVAGKANLSSEQILKLATSM